MARIFLSYDHRDVHRAKSIATLLEHAGHTVWWDRQIKAGAQFSEEIEQQLDRSDAIVVLWSERAVKSAWVRDEAAAGRDSGRLVPLRLDSASPPLGFRQYHNIDWSKSRGQRNSEQLSQLLASIDNLAAPKPPQPAKSHHRAIIKRVTGARIVAVPILLLFIGIAALIWWGRDSDAKVPTVAIQSADASEASQAVARDLLVRLTTLQSVNAGSIRLQAASVATSRPDLLFEAGASGDSKRRGQTLALLDGRDRAVLWSKDFNKDARSWEDIEQQVAFTAARVLDCALEALPPNEEPLEQSALKLYLTGCARFAESFGAGSVSLIPIFSEVVRRYPTFRAGWARLMLADASVAVQQPLDAQLSASMRRHLNEARKRDPEMVEATLLEVSLLPLHSYEKSLNLLDGAKQNDPNHPVVLSYRADELRSVGRMRESIEDAKRAADVDSLSPSARGSYVLALAYGGRIDAAKEELKKLEQLWPGTGVLQEIQFRFHLRFGDPQRALQMARTLNIGGKNQELFLVARADPTPNNIEQMMRHARPEGNGAVFLGFLVQALGEFGRTDRIVSILGEWPEIEDVRSLGDVYFRPALKGLRHDRRFMEIAGKAGLSSYWTRSGHWPDFCSEPDLPYDCRATARSTPK